MDGFEIVDPVFKTYVLGNAPLDKLGDGFRWTEGPVWFGDMGMLIFSDLPNDRVMRWSEADGVQLFRKPARHFANGHARDSAGAARHLFAPTTATSARLEHDGAVTVLCDQLRGQAAQRAERHRREVGRHDLVHRSALWFADGL